MKSFLYINYNFLDYTIIVVIITKILDIYLFYLSKYHTY